MEIFKDMNILNDEQMVRFSDERVATRSYLYM